MCYNVTRILVASRVCVMVNFTNPVCNEYVTSPRVTNELIIPSCIVHGGNGPVVVDIINDFNNLGVLRQGETLIHAVELDVIIDEESPQNRVQVCRTEMGENTNGGDDPLCEEVNMINNTPLPVAVSLIP